MGRKVFVGVTIDKDLDDKVISFLSRQEYGATKSAFFEKALNYYFENWIYQSKKDDGLLLAAIKRVKN